MKIIYTDKNIKETKDHLITTNEPQVLLKPIL